MKPSSVCALKRGSISDPIRSAVCYVLYPQWSLQILSASDPGAEHFSRRSDQRYGSNSNLTYPICGLLLLADTSLVVSCVPTSCLFDFDCLFIRAPPTLSQQ